MSCQFLRLKITCSLWARQAVCLATWGMSCVWQKYPECSFQILPKILEDQVGLPSLVCLALPPLTTATTEHQFQNCHDYFQQTRFLMLCFLLQKHGCNIDYWIICLGRTVYLHFFKEVNVSGRCCCHSVHWEQQWIQWNQRLFLAAHKSKVLPNVLCTLHIIVW